MPTLRRILKYTPAAVLGLLVVVWVHTYFQSDFISHDLVSGWHETYGLVECSVYWEVIHPEYPPLILPQESRWGILGFFEFDWDANEPGAYVVQVPIAVLVTAIFPMAIGALVSFRFHLWHYLAYTALIALEIAYYLRWHL
jgi:hypothetical protein